MEELIAKYLRGELSLDEQHQLSKWIQSDSRNAEILKKIHAYWHHHQDDLGQVELEVRLRLLARIQEESKSPVLVTKRNHRSLYLKIVAGLAAACIVLFGIYWHKATGIDQEPVVKITSIEKVSLPGQKITTLLPDGTKVKLNAGSKIIVPEKFIGETREVKLFGEAFFEVAKDESKPFIIHTENIQIKVLGTSFNVKSYPNQEMAEVAVASGKVAIENKNNEKEALLPGEKISYNKELQSMTKENFEWEEEYGWKENILLFKGENFSGIKKKLSNWYGVEFIIHGNAINFSKKFSGRYNDPSLKEVLDGLSYVYDFSYQIDNKKVTLDIK